VRVRVRVRVEVMEQVQVLAQQGEVAMAMRVVRWGTRRLWLLLRRRATRCRPTSRLPQ
jgi:hypothetical protein